MARFKPIPYSQQELKELLDYNAETGILSWRKSWRRRVAGAEAGYYGLNYKYVGLKGRDYFVHRVIWKWMTGEDPKVEIDHKTGKVLITGGAILEKLHQVKIIVIKLFRITILPV